MKEIPQILAQGILFDEGRNDEISLPPLAVSADEKRRPAVLGSRDRDNQAEDVKTVLGHLHFSPPIKAGCATSNATSAGVDALLRQCSEKERSLGQCPGPSERAKPAIEDFYDRAASINLRQRAVDRQSHLPIAARQ